MLSSSVGAGNFSEALRIARKEQEQFARLGMVPEAKHFEQVAKRLEEKLLTEGFFKILFDDQQQPRAPLLKLFNCMDLTPLGPAQDQLDQIQEWAKKLLRNHSQCEPWYRGELWGYRGPKFENQVQPLVDELGFLDAVAPSFREYQGVLVMGASLDVIRNRIHYLVKQWETGVRFSHIYFLSGERDLSPVDHRDIADDFGSPLKIRKDWIKPTEDKFPKTEKEMIEFVWDQADIPQEMRGLLVQFINAPKQTQEDKKPQKELPPPETSDTVISWRNTEPPAGRYLVISNAPYIIGDDVVVRRISPKTFTFDTVGEATSKNARVVACMLDVVVHSALETLFEIKGIHFEKVFAANRKTVVT